MRVWIAVVVLSGTAFAQPGMMDAGVKKVPFSADVVTEIKRTLQDGNQIDRTENGKIYRDSEGRVRHDNPHTTPNGTVIHDVTITDPVGHEFIMLRPDNTAIVRHEPTPQRPLPGAHTTVREPNGRLVKRENLGTQEIEGLTVLGTKITRTIPAGKVGNNEPILVVTERWKSPELHEIVLEETDDPQNGHHSMKFVNIDRTEPDPSLFQIPPDYKVVDEPRQ